MLIGSPRIPHMNGFNSFLANGQHLVLLSKLLGISFGIDLMVTDIDQFLVAKIREKHLFVG